MALPSVGALGANSSSASGTSVAVAAPASVVNLSVVVVGIFLDGAAQTVTPPAGWSEAENSPIDVSPTSHGLHVFWHRASGSEAGPYTFSWTSSTYRSTFAARIDNAVTSGTPFDSPTNSAMDSASATTSPAVSTTSLGADRLDIYWSTNWSGGTWTAPSGFTKQREGVDQVIVLCTHDHPTAGSTGALSASCTGSDKRTAFVGALIGTTSSAAFIAPPPLIVAQAVQRASVY